MSGDTGPQRTTFEVTVSNKLQHNPAYVQIQAELQYATNLSSSSNNNNYKKTYEQTAQSKQGSKSHSRSFKDTNVEQKYDNHKTHNKSSSSSHDTSSNSNYSSNSSNTSVKAKVGGIGWGASASVDHSNSNTHSSCSSSSSSKTQANDDLKHDISSTFNSQNTETTDAGTRSSAQSGLNIYSNEYNKDTSATSSAILENSKITPGFVRISCGQSLPIPVIVENESQVVYITVYIEDYKNGNRVCIANALQ
eukprot:484428_1